ncbi:MAG: RDD family protein, partial [Pyrinomonadaceae bacterium]
KVKFQEKPVQEKIAAPVKNNLPPESVQLPAPPVAGQQTTQITAKHTSPILVEFQSKNAVLPEWRLQLQNSVRRRGNPNGQPETAPVAYQKVLVTNGAAALKSEPIEQTTAVVSANPTLENALRRIEQSRQKYLDEEKPKLSIVQNQSKNFSPAALNKNELTDSFTSPAKSNESFSASAGKFEKFDTNKLPPLPAKVLSGFGEKLKISSAEAKTDKRESSLLEIKGAETTNADFYEEVPAAEITEDEIDDRAPLMLRFNAAFFDLIIGSFVSVILLAPFSLANGNLFTFQGFLAFLATCSIVMFIYLTATIGTMGRTLGMRLFGLELIDIEENDYPTFHQAAVSSSVYLVSLAPGGIGFLTLFLNDEKRAAHDLISGTIVVKECE